MPSGLVTVVNVQWHGSEALELTYKTAEGKVANELLYRHDEPRIEVVEQGRPWGFDGDGAPVFCQRERVSAVNELLSACHRASATSLLRWPVSASSRNKSPYG
jgi:hypothetical protein